MAVFNLPVLILSDRTAPVISGTSVGNPLSIDENIAASSLVATMTDDGTAVSYAIVSGNTNGDFAIANNGDITVVNSPDYETTSSYSLGITATDSLGNTSAPFTVTININDLDEIPPVVTLVSQPYVAVYETENNLTIASFTASDAGADVTNTLVLASGTPNTTNFSLSYNTSTQQMDLVTSASGLLGGGVTADQTFTFTISATDALGNTGSTTCNLVVKNAELPTVTGPTSISRQENTSTSTVIGTCTASGTAPFTWSITGGADASYFTVDSTTGQLRFATSPNYEQPGDSNTDNIYQVEVTATNQFGTGSGTISVTVTDDPIDEAVYYDWGHNISNLDNSRYFPVALTGFNNAIYSIAQSYSASDGYNHVTLVKADPTTGNWTIYNTVSSAYLEALELVPLGSYLYGFAYNQNNQTRYAMRLNATGGGQSFSATTSSTSTNYQTNPPTGYAFNNARVPEAGSTTEAWGYDNNTQRWIKYTASTGAYANAYAIMHNYPGSTAHSDGYKLPGGIGINVGNYVVFVSQKPNRQHLNVYHRPTATNLSNGTAFTYYGQISLASWPFSTYSNYEIKGIAEVGGYIYLSTRDSNGTNRVARYEAPSSSNILATLQLAE